MKTRRYYVVEVSHFKGNPVHRTIVKCVDAKLSMVQFLDYEDYVRRTTDQLHHFEIIAEINEMNKEATR